MSDVGDMMATLASCDLFYMSGIFDVPQTWVDRSNGPALSLVQEIQRRVQYNEMAFMGVCGGALMSGSQPFYGLAPLDLLQGAAVMYDINCSNAPVRTTPNVVQITTGCAVAIYIWRDRREAISFPVVKNSSKWYCFAADSTRALQYFVVQKCNSPEAFHSAEGVWFCSLAGYVYKNQASDIALLAQARTRSLTGLVAVSVLFV